MARVDEGGDAWERNADDWLAWTRTASHDHHHELVNFPRFIRLLPEGSHRILDVGCGEGRVGRWLSAHGHTVLGIDSSPTLTDAARARGGYEAVVTGDAARLPWPQRSFDLAVAYMALHDMPDPAAVIGEVARVLRPGGSLAVAVMHMQIASRSLAVWQRGSFFPRDPLTATSAHGSRPAIHRALEDVIAAGSREARSSKSVWTNDHAIHRCRTNAWPRKRSFRPGPAPRPDASLPTASSCLATRRQGPGVTRPRARSRARAGLPQWRQSERSH